MTRPETADIEVRRTQLEDAAAIEDICRRVYPGAAPWTASHIASHLEVFPEGQLVAEDRREGRVVGMAASLIVRWDEYEISDDWVDFTDNGMFTNHDPKFGTTLYGAEVMVDPERQGQGIGQKLYAARRQLAMRLGLKRIRAGARIRHYHRYADQMSPREYVDRVVRGELHDPTLSFQLKQGFRVIAVVGAYAPDDPESRGYAAVIEWLNPDA